MERRILLLAAILATFPTIAAFGPLGVTTAYAQLAASGPPRGGSTAQSATGADPPAAPPEGGDPVPPAEAAAPQPVPQAPPEWSEPPPPPPPPPPPAPPPPRRYADAGTSELGLGLGYSSYAGFVGAGGFRYFVAEGVAPGAEASYVSGGRLGAAYGLLLGSLRLVPVRTGNIALVLTGQAGRVLMGDHADGWAAGGTGGIIFLFSSGAGLELGYRILRLLPASFCADLTSCILQGPVLAFRFTL